MSTPALYLLLSLLVAYRDACVLAHPSEVIQNAYFNHRCALHVFECVGEGEDTGPAVPLHLFPKAQVSKVHENGHASVRFMCAYSRSQGNRTHTKGFRYKHWLKIGEKYTTISEAFRCRADDKLEAILSPAKRELCVLHKGVQQRVTYDAIEALTSANGSSEYVRCLHDTAVPDSAEGPSSSTGFCHSAPKSLRDIPSVERIDEMDHQPSTAIHFDSHKDVTHRTQKRTSPSYPHGWCQTAVFGSAAHQSASPYAMLIPYLKCPCVPITSVSFSDDAEVFKRKFTHFDWKQGRRIRKKHMAGHPGYDHSMPYSCEQICAPHFGFTKKEIQTFPDRAAMLDAMQKRHELFQRHESDPTKMCIIPPGARKTVGCRCAMRSTVRTPVKGTSRSYAAVNQRSPTSLHSPSMVAASAPCVSESFSMPPGWKANMLVDDKDEPELVDADSNTKRIINEAVRETVDEGAESWFPFFLSFSYSAACGSGSTSAFCEWWDFLQCLTESTALALSTVCDIFRWTF